MKETEIAELLEIGYHAWADQTTDDATYQDVSTWLLSNCTRADAEEHLAGLPTGTFLIRPRNVGNYALSISCNGHTNHCIVYETKRGYGFAIPYNIYETLTTLVLHYAHNSLEEHNDVLCTTLKHPVFSPFVMRFKQQQHQQQELEQQEQKNAADEDAVAIGVEALQPADMVNDSEATERM